MRGPNPKKHLAFSGLDAESLLRESAVVCGFLEEKGVIPRSGILSKTFGVQLVNLFPLAVLCQGQLKAY